jgi:nucleoside-diphosphate-sugar epimerase
MHISITGGMGFIGHNLARYLKNQGHHVTLIDDLRFVTDALYNQRNQPGIYDELKIFDCTKSSFNPEIHTDVVIHLACHPNQAAFDNEGLKKAWSNTTVSNSVVNRWAIKQKARYVYISSSMVYGAFKDRIREDADLAPVNDYGKAKMFCELAVQEAAHDWIIIRPISVYGPGDNPRRIISKWLAAARAGADIHVDKPEAILDLTYVEDLCAGIAAAATSTHSQQIYNMGGGQGYNLAGLAEKIINITNSSSAVLYGEGLPANMPSRGILDLTKAYNDLNYEPSTDLDSGLAKILAYDKLL